MMNGGDKLYQIIYYMMMTMASNVTKNVVTFWRRLGIIVNDAAHSLGHVTSFMKAPREKNLTSLPEIVFW